MRRRLSETTQSLVLSHNTGRGYLRKLADETEIEYIWLWRLVNNKLTQVDADKCQRLYEHLTGSELI